MTTRFKAGLYIGLISGTSLDAIDAALVDISPTDVRLLHAINWPIDVKLRANLEALCQPGDNEIERLGLADRAFGRALADAANQLLKDSGTESNTVLAIGSHGQTIRHRPADGARSTERAFTLQIGDPNTLAELTGITVVGDLRRRDIAAGGQAAPLVPPFHHAVFQSSKYNRAIVNIGGMSNITALPIDGEVTGFDTGPGNILMDCWIQRCQSKSYDGDGAWAASGTVNPDLLRELKRLPWFDHGGGGPRSTGREDFHLQALLDALIMTGALAEADVQATLLAFTVETIAEGLQQLPFIADEVYICGGGAANGELMRHLQNAVPASVQSTQALGWPPDFIEAAAFAWLASKTLNGEPGNITSVTGAAHPVILGGIFQA